jgi:hypothetical protein
MRSEVLTPVTMLTVVFWVVMLCGLVGGYQHFGGFYQFHGRENDSINGIISYLNFTVSTVEVTEVEWDVT